MEWYGMQSLQSIIPLRVALVFQSLVFLSSSQDRWLTQVAGFGHFSTKKKSRFAKQQQGGRERRLCPAQRLVDLNGYAKESDGIQGFQNPERSTSNFKFHKIDTCHYQTTLQSTNHLDMFFYLFPTLLLPFPGRGRSMVSIMPNLGDLQPNTSLKLRWELMLRLPPTTLQDVLKETHSNRRTTQTIKKVASSSCDGWLLRSPSSDPIQVMLASDPHNGAPIVI